MLEQQCDELEEMISQQGLGGAPQVVLAMMESRRALSARGQRTQESR